MALSFEFSAFWDFNSHAHVERDGFEDNLEVVERDFNSHAHVERDYNHPFIKYALNTISTHTLTWSVTIYTLYNFKTLRFQLTRSRGA